MNELDGVGQQAKQDMRFDNLADWLRWQESLHINEIELGLDRCREVAVRLGIDRANYHVVSVAGTNGKGSSVEMLHSILSAQGYRLGCYTSPHLLRYNERIRLFGQPVEDQQICEAFQRIDEARKEISLTYFEFNTLAAMYLFFHAEIDLAILEVGLGGRLDAVNLLDADLALVTSIDLDHQDWLGDNRESIGREKAGIFRHNQYAVCADPDSPESIRLTAESLGTQLSLLNRDFSYSRQSQEWCWQASDQVLDGLPLPNLVGDFQLQNAAGVLMILNRLKDKFPVSPEAIRYGLTHVSLAGRFQCFDGDVQVVLDVAHNPQAAALLVETLHSRPVAGRTHIVFGMLKDKDVIGVVRLLAEIADDWYVAGLGVARGMDCESQVEIIQQIDKGGPVNSYESVTLAYSNAERAARVGDRILVVGSFLTVSAVLKMMNDEGQIQP